MNFVVEEFIVLAALRWFKHGNTARGNNASCRKSKICEFGNKFAKLPIKLCCKYKGGHWWLVLHLVNFLTTEWLFMIDFIEGIKQKLKTWMHHMFSRYVVSSCITWTNINCSGFVLNIKEFNRNQIAPLHVHQRIFGPNGNITVETGFTHNDSLTHWLAIGINDGTCIGIGICICIGSKQKYSFVTGLVPLTRWITQCETYVQV